VRPDARIILPRLRAAQGRAGRARPAALQNLRPVDGCPANVLRVVRLEIAQPRR